MNIFLKIPPITLLLLATLRISPAQVSCNTEEVILLRQTPQRKAETFHTLYALVPTMPQEIIKLILTYEPPVLFVLASPVLSLIGYERAQSNTTYVAAGGEKGILELWDIKREPAACCAKLGGHTGPVSALAIQTNPKDNSKQLLISASTLYGKKVGKIIPTDKEMKIVSADQYAERSDDTVNIWNLQTKKLIYRLQPDTKRIVGQEEIAKQMRKTQKRLLLRGTTVPDPVIVPACDRTWTMRTKEHIEDGVSLAALPFKASDHTAGIMYCKLSNELYAKVFPNGTILILNTCTNDEFLLHGHIKPIVCLQLHGKFLLSTSQDCSIKIWDIAQQKCIHTITSHLKPVRALWVSKDGVIVSGADDGTVMAHTIKECAN